MGSTAGRQQFLQSGMWSYAEARGAPEIEVVHVGDKPTKIIPFIPTSRLSKVFRDYLKGQSIVCPAIFPDKDWNDPKRKEKPVIITIGKNDVAAIWSEVERLAKKYNYSKFQDWMPIYYFLASSVLKTKIECLEKATASGSFGQNVVIILSDANRMLKFQYFMMIEMVYRYVEMKWQGKGGNVTVGERLPPRKRRRTDNM